MKINFQLHHWPVLVSGWILTTFVISYIVAVAEKNVDPLFPFISELGAWRPSSSIFGLMMNIGALLIAITLYIRYQQVESAVNSTQCSFSKKWNEIALWLGFVSVLGMCFVANFQGDFEGYFGVFIMHIIGAAMAFGIGGIYLAIQVRITFGLRPYYKEYTQFGVSIFIQYCRLISTMIFFANLLFVLVFAALIPRESNGYRVHRLRPEEDGYSFRVMSVISEWVLAFIFIFNFLTLTKELKAISFQGISFKRAEQNLKIEKIENITL